MSYLHEALKSAFVAQEFNGVYWVHKADCLVINPTLEQIDLGKHFTANTARMQALISLERGVVECDACIKTVNVTQNK
jgi:hypothetical protein